MYLYALGVLHGGDVEELEMLLTAELSSHISELLCYPDQTHVQVELCRECHNPVPEHTHRHFSSKYFDTKNMVT